GSQDARVANAPRRRESCRTRRSMRWALVQIAELVRCRRCFPRVHDLRHRFGTHVARMRRRLAPHPPGVDGPPRRQDDADLCDCLPDPHEAAIVNDAFGGELSGKRTDQALNSVSICSNRAHRTMRSVVSTPEANLDNLDTLDVVTSVVAIRDQ